MVNLEEVGRRRNGLPGRGRTEKEWFTWKTSNGEGMVYLEDLGRRRNGLPGRAKTEKEAQKTRIP